MVEPLRSRVDMRRTLDLPSVEKVGGPRSLRVQRMTLMWPASSPIHALPRASNATMRTAVGKARSVSTRSH